MFNDKIESQFHFDCLVDDVLQLICFYLSFNDLSSLAFVSTKYYQSLNAPSFWKEKIKKEFQRKPQGNQHPALYYKQLLLENYEFDLVVAYGINLELLEFIRGNENRLQITRPSREIQIALESEKNSLTAALELLTKLTINIEEELKKNPAELLSFQNDLEQLKIEWPLHIKNVLINQLNNTEFSLTRLMQDLICIDAPYLLERLFTIYNHQSIDYIELWESACSNLNIKAASKLLELKIDVNQPINWDKKTPLFHIFSEFYILVKEKDSWALDINNKKSALNKLENFTKLLLQHGADPDLLSPCFDKEIASNQEEVKMKFAAYQVSSRTLCYFILSLLEDNATNLENTTKQKIKTICQMVINVPEKIHEALEQIEETEENPSHCAIM